jgi:hypothetical protein
MGAHDRHRIRHKGVETDPLSRSDILAQLREGRLSLAHAIEVRGKWMTLRQHLAETAAPSEGEVPAHGKGSRGRTPPPPPGGGDHPPPPPGSAPGAPPLDSVIRSGYVWCGLTFGLPFLIVFLPWLFRSQLGLGGPAGSLALLAGALGSVAYAHARARRAAAEIQSEGLDDVAASVRNLAAGLGVASGVLWTLAALL